MRPLPERFGALKHARPFLADGIRNNECCLLVDTGGEGGRLFRLVGDMAWALDKGIGIGELMAFERDYSHSLARRIPIVSLRQYDTRRFTGTAVHEALLCHQDTFSRQLSRFL